MEASEAGILDRFAGRYIDAVQGGRSPAPAGAGAAPKVALVLLAPAAVLLMWVDFLSVLLVLPWALALHAVGLRWMRRDGATADVVRRLWWIWGPYLAVLGVTAAATATVGLPGSDGGVILWTATGGTGSALLLLIPLFPAGLAGATAGPLWPYADRFGRLALSAALAFGFLASGLASLDPLLGGQGSTLVVMLVLLWVACGLLLVAGLGVLRRAQGVVQGHRARAATGHPGAAGSPDRSVHPGRPARSARAAPKARADVPEAPNAGEGGRAVEQG